MNEQPKRNIASRGVSNSNMQALRVKIERKKVGVINPHLHKPYPVPVDRERLYANANRPEYVNTMRFQKNLPYAKRNHFEDGISGIENDITDEEIVTALEKHKALEIRKFFRDILDK
ncbi:unnamed protein product [Clavelina lepadiformis]|uniref:Uncharacterized protein n=1 Tax=Clavelina lepadiformis TaxID=159417 RepID=A0ABP0F892_CLALP